MAFLRTVRAGLFAGPLTVLALSACGGGGSTPPVPLTAPTSSPTATPAPNPTASGDTFSYAGSLTQTFTVFATPAPSPSPSATPQPASTPWVSTLSQSVTQNVTVSSGASFGAQTGLTEFTTQESDASALKTSTSTAHAYLSFVPDSSRAGGVDVTVAGTESTDSEGASFQSAFASGNGVVAQLPYVYGAQWSNGAARTDSEKDADGQTSSATFAADGSYQEKISYPEGGTAAVTSYPDGSGVYQLPFQGLSTKPSTVSVDAPSGGEIQLGYELYSLGLPQAGAFTLPVWYPQTPPVLASDSYVDEGAAHLPSSCDVGTSYQSANVEKIVETKTRLDPIFGEYESDRIVEYTGQDGLLCAVAQGDLKSYYDFSGQSDAAFAFSAAPLEETTVSQTLGLQSAHFATAASVSRRMAQTSGAFIARPSFARMHAILAAAHARHARALYAHIKSISRTRLPQ